MAPRYIQVPVEGRPAPLDVRVITPHPDDDKLRKELYKVENLWDWCDGQRKSLTGFWRADSQGVEQWCPPSVSQLDLEKTAEVTAGVNIIRDRAVRELCKLVLADKLNGEQVDEVLTQCNAATVVNIFMAAKGIDQSALLKKMYGLKESPAPSSPEPSTPSTPTAS